MRRIRKTIAQPYKIAKVKDNSGPLTQPQPPAPSPQPPFMPRVIVLDTLAQEGLEMLARAPGIEHDVRTGLKGDADIVRYALRNGLVD